MFVTWDVRSPCVSGSLTAAARDLVRYKLDLVDVQEVRCDKGHGKGRGLYFFNEKETKIINSEEEFL